MGLIVGRSGGDHARTAVQPGFPGWWDSRAAEWGLATAAGYRCRGDDGRWSQITRFG